MEVHVLNPSTIIINIGLVWIKQLIVCDKTFIITMGLAKKLL